VLCLVHGHGRSIGWIELVPRVAGVVHHNLNCHYLCSWFRPLWSEISPALPVPLHVLIFSSTCVAVIKPIVPKLHAAARPKRHSWRPMVTWRPADRRGRTLNFLRTVIARPQEAWRRGLE
jgi:hypothetical protein